MTCLTVQNFIAIGYVEQLNITHMTTDFLNVSSPQCSFILNSQFYCGCGTEGPFKRPCKLFRQLVKPSWGLANFSMFKMAAVRRLVVFSPLPLFHDFP